MPQHLEERQLKRTQIRSPAPQRQLTPFSAIQHTDEHKQRNSLEFAAQHLTPAPWSSTQIYSPADSCSAEGDKKKDNDYATKLKPGCSMLMDQICRIDVA